MKRHSEAKYEIQITNILNLDMITRNNHANQLKSSLILRKGHTHIKQISINFARRGIISPIHLLMLHVELNSDSMRKKILSKTINQFMVMRLVFFSIGWAGFTNPPNWNNKMVWELDPSNSANNGYENEDLIVWMRTAALPNFRKLHRRVFNNGTFVNGLPKGTYTMEVSYCKCKTKDK